MNKVFWRDPFNDTAMKDIMWENHWLLQVEITTVLHHTTYMIEDSVVFKIDTNLLLIDEEFSYPIYCMWKGTANESMHQNHFQIQTTHHVLQVLIVAYVLATGHNLVTLWKSSGSTGLPPKATTQSGQLTLNPACPHCCRLLNTSWASQSNW